MVKRVWPRPWLSLTSTISKAVPSRSPPKGAVQHPLARDRRQSQGGELPRSRARAGLVGQPQGRADRTHQLGVQTGVEAQHEDHRAGDAADERREKQERRHPACRRAADGDQGRAERLGSDLSAEENHHGAHHEMGTGHRCV